MIRYSNAKSAFLLYYSGMVVSILFSIYMINIFAKIIYNVNVTQVIVNAIDTKQMSKNIITRALPITKYMNVNYSENSEEYSAIDVEINQDADEEKYKVGTGSPNDIAILNNSKKEIIDAYSNKNNTDLDKIIRGIYLFESNITMTKDTLKLDKLLLTDMKTNLTSEPKVLILHTHSQEAFVDSRPEVEEDNVVGVGKKLADILYKKYGVKSIHHKGKYDVINGKLNRNGSYTRASVEIEKILKKNPQIEIVIDIHRDGIPGTQKLVTNINGKPTARLMFVNGLCEKLENGKMKKIPNLPNKYIEENMALSLQMQLAANLQYPNLMRKILLKPYRYSLYMKPKSLLVEVGAQTSTVEEAKNAMEPLAKTLVDVLNS